MVHHVSFHHQTPHPLLDRLSANWWLLLLRGIAAIAFGVLALLWPGSAFLAVVLLFGIYAFGDGVVSLCAAFAGNDEGLPTWWLVVVGLFGMAAGIITVGWPGVTGAFLVRIIAVWAVLSGIVQIMGAFELRKEIHHEWLLLISGVLSVVAGLFVISFPGIGAVALVSMLAIYALIFGALWIALANRLRTLRN